MDHNMKWVWREVKERGVHSPKTLIFAPSHTIVNELYVSAFNYLSINIYNDPTTPSPDTRMITTFQKDTDSEEKDHILKMFKNSDSNIRVVISTTALSMGIDVKGIRRVVLYGLGQGVALAWQEAGRCARDELPGFIVLVPSSVSGKEKDFFDKMRQKKSCMRVMFLEYFVFPGVECTKLEELKGRVECTCKKIHCLCPFCTCCRVCRNNCVCRNA